MDVQTLRMNEEILSLCKQVQSHLQKEYHPHISIIITDDRVSMVEDLECEITNADNDTHS